MAITTSATCGKCGRAVAASARAGDHCPHCGARFSAVRESRIEIEAGIDWKRVFLFLAGGMVVALALVFERGVSGRSRLG